MEVLTAEDRKAIEKALKDAELLKAELQRARRAGIDVSELEAKLREAELALKNIAKVYLGK